MTETQNLGTLVKKKHILSLVTSKDFGNQYYIHNVTSGGYMNIHTKICVPECDYQLLTSSDLE